MKHEIPFRIIVRDPPAGVAMKVQKGKFELVAPAATNANGLVFDIDITVDLGGDAPNFLGKFAQGPKGDRFVYVNSGSYAGQAETWNRRAKLSLMLITRSEIDSVLADAGSRFEVSIQGTARDGGPVCASVKDLLWQVAK